MRVQHQRVGVVAPAGAERARDRRRDAAAHRAGRQHLHHHEAGEHQRHAGQRVGAEARDPPGLDQAGRGLRQHHQDVRPGHAQQRRHDRAVQQAARARAHRRRRAAVAAGAAQRPAARRRGRSSAAGLRRGRAGGRGGSPSVGGRGRGPVRRRSRSGARSAAGRCAVDQDRLGRRAGAGVDDPRRRLRARSAGCPRRAAPPAPVRKSRPRSVSTYSSRGGCSL